MTPSNPKKPSPFSLRLTFEERARLESEAGTLPLGAYIKLKLLSEGEVPAHRLRPRRPLKDQEALGQLLALLGRARLANNLNQLAHAANTGSLPVTPDTPDLQRTGTICAGECRAPRGIGITGKHPG